MDSDTQLNVLSPAGPPGRTDVRVTTRGGTSPPVLADRFLVHPAGYPFCGTQSGPPTTTKLLVIYEENQSASAIYRSTTSPWAPRRRGRWPRTWPPGPCPRSPPSPRI